MKLLSKCVGMLLALLVLSVPLSAMALNPVVITQNSEIKALQLLPYIVQYKGETVPNNIQQASKLPDADYVPLGKTNPIRPLQTQWFRFAIRNDSTSARELVMDLSQALFKRIDLQTSVNGVAVKYVQTGQSYPRSTRDIAYDFFAFRLDVPAGKTLVVDFLISTPYAVLFMPTLMDEQAFVSHSNFNSAFFGGIIGVQFSICFFLTIYAIRARRIGVEAYMWLFSVLCYLSMNFLSGAIQRAFLADRPDLVDIVYLCIHILQPMVFVLVLRSLYQTPLSYPKFNIALTLMAGLDFLCLLSIPFVNIEWSIVALISINFVIILIAFLLAMYSVIIGDRKNNLLSFGVIAFVVMVTYATLAAYGVLPKFLIAERGYELGLVSFVGVFFIAVAGRIFVAETEKLVMENKMTKLNADIRARSEFVDKVTHDIKSPLSAVIGSVPLLRNATTQEQREKYFDVIQRSCSAVLAIIDDILGFSRLQSGQMELHLERVNLEVLLAEIKNSVEVVYQTKPIQLALVINEAVPQWVMSDRTRLYQLLNNLLTNAFKFTDEGRVSLALDVAEKKAGKVFVRFVVQDTGIGMSEEFLLTAFEPYAREINNAGYRPGFGLGLPICKQIVELMGGTIDVMSVLGQGSRFTVVLPFDVAQ